MRSPGLRKGIASAPAACFVFLQDAALKQIGDVAQCGVLRALRQLRPFLGPQFSFESVKQPVDNLALAIIE